VTPAARRHSCFAVIAPGFESVAVAELRALGATDAVAEPGGVAFSADDALLLTVNLWSRVASRVLVRVAEFPAKSFAELERRAKTVRWKDWLPSGATKASAEFAVTCKKSRLYHSDAIAERLGKWCGAPVGGDVVQQFVVRLMRDVVTISADASGELLHKRGYRLATAKAPMRETIAAGCLLALGYDGTQPLADFMCGAGTIPIEAALIAQRIAPGQGRAFSCEAWPGFDRKAGAKVRAAAGAAVHQSGAASITAADRDEGAIEATRANAARAGVAESLTILTQSFGAAAPPVGSSAGLILINPPYGERVTGGPDLRNLYAQIGNVMCERFAGWRLAMVSADPALEAQVKLPLSEVLRFSNGGIRVRLVATKG